MKQKSSNFGANGLKISKNASNNAVLGSKKGLIRYCTSQAKVDNLYQAFKTLVRI